MDSRTSSQGKRALQRFVDASGLIVVYPDGADERMTVLQALAERIAPRQAYSEQAINELIQQHVHPAAADHVTVRRDLVDYQFIRRTDGGARYWRDEAGVGVPPRVQSGPGAVGPDHVAGERETE